VAVQFYLPGDLMPSAERQRAWEKGEHQVLEQGGKAACAQCWIYQTWLHLRQAGIDVGLTHRLPNEGAVLAITGNLPPSWHPPHDLFVAGIVADGLPHPRAHLHIVQNAAHAKRLPRSTFMPLWPQPGLLPRDTARGGRMECVAFFGDSGNAARELTDPDWQNELHRATGVRFEIRGADRWHDYSDVDAVIAVRDFGGGRQLHKPATKLYNAWLAGVPFIGGADSAYAAEGQAGVDYLVARSPEDVIAHLKRLGSDQSLRTRLVENGRTKSLERTPAAITGMWRDLVVERIPDLVAARGGRSGILNFCADNSMRALLALDRIFRN